MARTLEFRFEGQSFKCGLEKVDRSSLYGSVDVETRDPEGLRCEVATLAQDRRTLIPFGGIAHGYMNPAGRWLERGELVAVNEQGSRVNTVASSFDSPIDLEVKTGIDRFLDHAIRSSYLLAAAEPMPAPLQSALDGGTIFKFDFSYRGGANADPAFLLKGTEDTLWMHVGEAGDINFVGLAQAAVLESDPAGGEGGADDLDFDML